MAGRARPRPSSWETQKALGFVKYFWKHYPGPVERLVTMAMIGPIFGAIWGRVTLLRLKAKLQNLLNRRRAADRLRRIRRSSASR